MPPHYREKPHAPAPRRGFVSHLKPHMKALPVSVPQLIKELDETFPNRCPSPTMTDREIWMAVGERRLVEHLLARLKAAEENNSLPTPST